MTNHTLEKPNDWWQLHLPLVISLKLTQIPVTQPRYDTPPYHTLAPRQIGRRTSVTMMSGRAAARRRHTCLNLPLSNVKH